MSEKSNLYHCYTLTNGDHVVKLYEVAHVAPIKMYNNVLDGLEQDKKNGHIVHLEGIKFAKKHKDDSSLIDLYRMIAENTGNAMQLDHIKPTMEGFVNKDYTDKNFNMLQKIRIKNIRRFAKLVVKVLEKEDLLIENAAPEEKEKLLKKKAHHVLIFNRYLYNKLGKEEIKPSLVHKLFGLNSHLTLGRSLHATREAMKETQDVSLVWGKAHSREIREELLANGYDQVRTTVIIDTYNELLEKKYEELKELEESESLELN